VNTSAASRCSSAASAGGTFGAPAGPEFAGLPLSRPVAAAWWNPLMNGPRTCAGRPAERLVA